MVEGLEGGDRFAIVQKAHHSVIDGISGVDLIAVLLRGEAFDDFEPGPLAAAPGAAGQRAARGRAAPPRRRRRGAPALPGPGALRAPGAFLASLRESAQAVAETLAAGFRPASHTPLNHPSARTAASTGST